MKITTHNTTGRVTLYPSTNPTPRAWLTIREVDSLPEGDGVLQWDAEANDGAGALVRVPAPPPPVPQSVTPRQIRLALIDRGIMPDDITAQLTAIEDPVLRAKSLAEWEFASAVRRDHPLIAQLAVALDFTSEDVDAIFREAKAIGA